MSIKMMQQIQEDHLNIQDIKNKKEKNYNEKFSQLRDDLAEFKKDVDKKFDMILHLLVNRTSEYPISKEDKHKIDILPEDIPTFIPDIDTSDMSMNAKEDKEHLKDVDLEEGLEALNELIEQSNLK